MKTDLIKNKAVGGFLWRFLQNGSTQAIAFVITIILARLLTPDDYGLVAMINVFTAVALVFINTGFSSAAVQKRDLTEIDKSTLFFSGIAVALVLYAILFIVSPYVAEFYDRSELVALLRAQALTVVIGSFYSLHQALVTRDLLFRKSFAMSLSGVLVQGVVGISLAYMGFGPWALVISTLANNMTCCAVIWCLVKWKPRRCFSLISLNEVFGFSFKMLLASLIDALYNNLRDFVIGKHYSSRYLAFYQQGFRFPSTAMTLIDGAMTTVLFSTLSKYQDDWEEGLGVLRRAMRTSIFVCAPLMAGLFATAEPLVTLLLTEKWSPCVEYLQLGTVICVFWPLSARAHALNALGKSGITLALKTVGQVIGLGALILTFRHGISTMMIGTIIASLISLLISMVVCSKHLKYRVTDQISDCAPPILLSIVMGGLLVCIGNIEMGSLLKFIVQVLLGVLIYVVGAIVFRMDSLPFLIDAIKQLTNREGKNETMES